MLLVVDGGVFDIKTYLPTLNSTIKFGKQINNNDQMTLYIIGEYELAYELPNCMGTPFVQSEPSIMGIFKAYAPQIPPKYYRVIKTSYGMKSKASAIGGDGVSCVNYTFLSQTRSFSVEEVTLPFTTPIAWPAEIR